MDEEKKPLEGEEGTEVTDTESTDDEVEEAVEEATPKADEEAA